MVWANALVLGFGALLLAVPVILHFMMQSKPQEMPFPALRFIKERQHRSRSKMRLRHILLMLLRCLLILLLAAALAGPSVASAEFGNWLILGGVAMSALLLLGLISLSFFSRKKSNTVLLSVLGVMLVGHLLYGGWSALKLLGSDSTQLLGDSSAPVAALVLVDTSPRMEYVHENKPLLEKAIEIGDWVIGQLPLDSQVSILATDRDRPFFSVDIGAAKKRLDTLEVTYNSGFIPSTLFDGLKMLQKSELERREVYILTDMTERSWMGDASDKVARLLEQDPSISVFVFDVGPEQVSNFSLSPPRLSSVILPEASSFGIDCQISRIGQRAQRSVKLVVEQPDLTRPVTRDGKTLVPDQFWERTISVDAAPEMATPISFQFSEPLPIGVHHGRIELVAEDGLAIDNARYFTVEVRKAFKSLVVYGPDVTPDNFVDSIESKSEMFDCTVVSQSEMSEFDEYSSVCLLNPGPISNTTWMSLEKFVRSGGGLLIFLGNNAAAKGGLPDVSFTTKEAARVLSGNLARQWRRPEGDLMMSLDNLAHPVFSEFRAIETSIPWMRHPIFRHWQIEAPESAESEKDEQFPTQTLMRFSQGMPAMIERMIGEGRVLIMTTPITELPRSDTRWNDLFSGRPWPAWKLVNSMAEYVVENEAGNLNVNVGQAVSLSNDVMTQPETYNVYTPALNERSTKVTVGDNEKIRYKFTDLPGHYRLKGKLLGPVIRGFSVNLLQADTELKRLSDGGLDGVFGEGRYELAKEKTEIQRQQGATRRGQEFYPFLVLMMVVILAVEYLMSNRFYSSS